MQHRSPTPRLTRNSRRIDLNVFLQHTQSCAIQDLSLRKCLQKNEASASESEYFDKAHFGGETMSVTQQTMTDEQRKSVALEYLKRLDRGENFFDLFADDAQVCFPKWGVANGRAQIEKLFSEFASILSSIRHDYAYFNYIIQGDHVVVEGT